MVLFTLQSVTKSCFEYVYLPLQDNTFGVEFRIEFLRYKVNIVNFSTMQTTRSRIFYFLVGKKPNEVMEEDHTDVRTDPNNIPG